MNYTSAVMLVNPNIRAIHVIYEKDIEGKPPQTRYTFKTLDSDLKAGDLVVIPTDTRHGFTVVEVVNTDVEVDFDSPTQLKWVVGRVDLQGYYTVLLEEGKAISAIKESEKRMPESNTASVGIDRDGKWWGWSHRAIASFDTREQAAEFAESVS
jgi:hypothetical protein